MMKKIQAGATSMRSPKLKVAIDDLISNMIARELIS